MPVISAIAKLETISAIIHAKLCIKYQAECCRVTPNAGDITIYIRINILP